MILGFAAVPEHYAESPPNGQRPTPTISRFRDFQRSCTIICKTRKILCDAPGIAFVAVIAAQCPAARYDRVACSGRLRVDPKTIEGVGKQLIMLVKQTLGAKATLPDPFPVETQLSDLGVSSLKMVNLMLAVELEFDIAIPQSDITPENFHSVAAIQSLVVRTLSQRKSV